MHTQSAANSDTYPSVSLIYDLIKDRLAEQSSRVDAIDTKAGIVLGTASVVMGLVVAFQATVPLIHGIAAGQKLIRILLVIPQLDAYCLAAWMAYRAFGVRAYDYAPTPTEVLKYKQEAEWFTRAQVSPAMEAAYTNNETVIADKVRWLRRSLQALIAQVIVLAVALTVEIAVS